MWILLFQLKNQNVTGDSLCETEAAAKTSVKRVKQVNQTPSGGGIEKARIYLKNNDLLAVLFDKRVGICTSKKDQYEAKL